MLISRWYWSFRRARVTMRTLRWFQHRRSRRNSRTGTSVERSHTNGWWSSGLCALEWSSSGLCALECWSSELCALEWWSVVVSNQISHTRGWNRLNHLFLTPNSPVLNEVLGAKSLANYLGRIASDD